MKELFLFTVLMDFCREKCGLLTNGQDKGILLKIS